MARIAGRNGRIYMGIASGTADASPLAFQARWSMNFTVEKFDVTAFGDSGKTYVSGLPDAAGEFAGFYDDTTAQTYTAASDGVARKFYLYPSTSGTPGTGQYWFGTVLPDMTINGDVAGPVEVSATWNAASPIIKVG